MVLLGVDPGLLFAGFGVVRQDKGITALLEYGCLKMSSSSSVPYRISLFHDHFQATITKWAVTDVALETPFLGKNAQNFLKLGYLRGIVYLLAEKNEITLHEFSPREIKQAVTGFGGADKDQVARIVHRLFPGLNTDVRADTTDALAIALCGLWRTKSGYARLLTQRLQ